MSDDQNGGLSLPWLENYQPITNWAKFWNIAPKLDIDLFNFNPDDCKIEQRVVNEIGSYGKQLGRVIKVLSLLVTRSELKEGDFSPAQQVEVAKFQRMAERRKEALATHRKELGVDDTPRILDFIEHCHEDHPQDFQLIANRCKKLSAPPEHPAVGKRRPGQPRKRNHRPARKPHG
jgi:hypothetical protein